MRRPRRAVPSPSGAARASESRLSVSLSESISESVSESSFEPRRTRMRRAGSGRAGRDAARLARPSRLFCGASAGLLQRRRRDLEWRRRDSLFGRRDLLWRRRDLLWGHGSKGGSGPSRVRRGSCRRSVAGKRRQRPQSKGSKGGARAPGAEKARGWPSHWQPRVGKDSEVDAGPCWPGGLGVWTVCVCVEGNSQ